MTVIFFGSSDFSLAALKACIRSGKTILLVITTPDKKKGRGLMESPTPVKQFAIKNGLAVESPENLKSPDLLEKIKALKPDLFVVSSYGKMIPASWLKIPSRYALNVHPSLLPLYRGAAPINWPLLNNDKITGVSIAEVTENLDAGDIFYQTQITIRPDHDSANLTAELAELSAKALESVFSEIDSKKQLSRKTQNDAASTYAQKLTKENGRIKWDKSAEEIFGQIRGLLPWPIAFTSLAGEPLQILKASISAETFPAQRPGSIAGLSSAGLCVQTGKGILCIEKLKPAGKKEMPALDYARGKRIQPGQRMGE